jgi:hypothetical protein
MKRLDAWVDAKPYRIPLMPLAHTAILGAILLAMVRF